MNKILGKNPFAGENGINIQNCINTDYEKIETNENEIPSEIISLCYLMLSLVR
jgi:hypothetical protein